MLIQWLIVAVLVAWSLGFVLRRFVPAALLEGLSARFTDHGWTRLAGLVMPAAKAGCGSGCSSCSPACASHGEGEAAAVLAQPVKWQSPPSSGACH